MTAIGGDSRLAKDGSVWTAVDSGATIYEYLPLPNGWYRVTRSERGSEGTLVLDAVHPEFIEKHLVMLHANSLRSSRGLPMLLRRDQGWPAAPETVIRPTHALFPDSEVFFQEEVQIRGIPVARFPGAPTSRYSTAVHASWYMEAPLSLVIQSIDHPTGAPLFRSWAPTER
ncbi:Imm61 family immunity protein [Mycetocola saprophilus]|uniref:Imm61 family immunity protein n=1 Tax=Mycetocola saprophilus TaxID=76636 RepID=UPI003CCC0174